MFIWCGGKNRYQMSHMKKMEIMLREVRWLSWGHTAIGETVTQMWLFVTPFLQLLHWPAWTASHSQGQRKKGQGPFRPTAKPCEARPRGMSLKFRHCLPPIIHFLQLRLILEGFCLSQGYDCYHKHCAERVYNEKHPGFPIGNIHSHEAVQGCEVGNWNPSIQSKYTWKESYMLVRVLGAGT